MNEKGKKLKSGRFERTAGFAAIPDAAAGDFTWIITYKHLLPRFNQADCFSSAEKGTFQMPYMR